MAKDISILTLDVDDSDGQLRGGKDVRYTRVKVSATHLEAQLKEFMKNIDQVITQLPPKVGGFAIDSVTLTVEVSAKGTISLLGTGGELAGKGGLSFTLKRGEPKRQE